MYRVAICDDNTAEGQHTLTLAKQVLLDRNLHAEFSIFSDPHDMTEHIRKGGGSYDLLLLDILFDKTDGIQHAESAGNYVILRTSDHTELARLRATLSETLHRLGIDRFARCHKGYIVHMRQIQEVRASQILLHSGEATVTFTILALSPYDINKDGVVNLLDVTRAQRFYGLADSAADIDGNGAVGIEDLVLILNNFDEPFA